MVNWRQKLHLEPPFGWLNDPNGLCQYKGMYHVYFQFAPDSAEGNGKKCWGHYESKNLLEWEYCGIVLEPDIPEDENGVYSGSAIEKDGTLYLFYTGNVKKQGNYDYILEGREGNTIFVTTEDGRKMSEKKVVLRNSDYPDYLSCHVRDPKIWYEDGIYKMVLGARTKDDRGCIIIYTSKDLEQWSLASEYTIPDFGFMWECPEIFTVDNQKYLSLSPQGVAHEKTKFQNVYSAGYFNEKEFIEWDYGFDFYAPQTFVDADGRRILIGWMGIGDIPYTNATTQLGWQHCLTLPRVISRGEDGSLCQNPIGEINTLHGDLINAANKSTITIPLPFDLFAAVTDKFEIIFNNGLRLYYKDNMFYMEFTDHSLGCGRDIRRVVVDDLKDIRIIADMSSIEIYMNGGRYVMSSRMYPSSENVELYFDGIEAEIYKLKGMEMKNNGK